MSRHLLSQQKRPPLLRRAFTLVEVIISIALAGLLLTALSLVSFDIMSVWAAQADDPAFDRHVDGLRRALEECIAETNDAAASAGTAAVATSSGVSGAGGATVSSGSARAASSVFGIAPADAGVERATYLRITSAPAFLRADTAPIGFVHGWLCAEDDGLVLYWQTDDERTDSAEETHRIVLSAWVEQMTFLACSDSSDTWEEVDAANPENIESGSAIFMQLFLRHGGQSRQITLLLTSAAPHNLNY
ncbi:MAG: prepilin-type N-terminal cleavage/methylation domain-containing protein [Puniceicoccales bacterium]|jgi:prepilin-type N-terminal cleavage/methylation domain-containing protein|nr:prepilin-type N-terminal cleavage/methylation domain-containing protein [Puniceicoccales bacterium]